MGKADNLIILENGTIYDPYKNKKKAGSIIIEDGVVKEVIPFVVNKDDGRIKKATIAENGNFCSSYEYLYNYIKT